MCLGSHSPMTISSWVVFSGDRISNAAVAEKHFGKYFVGWILPG